MFVSLKPDGIELNGQPLILLTSSLFYFRVPRDLWRERMIKIRQAGYNAIDVYFPWNYHERSQGKWDFRGERDISEFLHLAVEVGLWVIARPGPYICSEWDGGGLPAYLLPKPGMRLRDNDPRYLRYVSRWFDRILPILAAFEVGHGGTVIAVQLENELDFYDCQDRPGYMEALREMAHDHGIRVPLIGCAGQGDLRGATGGVAGIIPTCNFYNPDTDPGVEQRAYHFHKRLQQQGLPLLVTETNRSHFYLRRLLSAGAKLLGPYLQTGGVNFGFTQAVNNWGQPLALIASDYDFGGMISSIGALREEFGEAVLFSRSMAAFGAGLARAVPVGLPDGTLRGGLQPVEGGPYALELSGGGCLIALPNFTGQPQNASLRLDDLEFPCHSQLMIDSLRCPLLALNIDLAQWGMQGRLIYTTAEIARGREQASLVLYGDGSCETALELPQGTQVSVDGMQLFQEGDCWILVFKAGEPASARIQYPNGDDFTLFGLDRAAAARALVEADEHMAWGDEPSGEPSAPLPLDWQAHPLDHVPGVNFHTAASGSRAPFLEEMDFFRGYGWYRSQVSFSSTQPVTGYLLQGGADVLSLYVNDHYAGTVTPGGGSVYLPGPVAEGMQDLKFEVRAEIWGHSNFDDARLPALQLNGMRGLAGLAAVMSEREITSNWHMHLLDEAESKDLYTARDVDTDHWPLVSFAGWLSTRSPNRICYRKEVVAGSGPVDRWVLWFPGLTRPVEVSANGARFTHVTPLDPYIDITANVRPGKPLELSVYGEQDYHGQLSARVVLLEGKSADGWQVAGLDENDMVLSLASAVEASVKETIGLPLHVMPGELALLSAGLPEGTLDRKLLCRGRNAKLSIFFNDHLVGRVWLDCGPEFPRVTGGSPNQVYLPGPWGLEGGSHLLVLVEAVRAGEPGIVEALDVA